MKKTVTVLVFSVVFANVNAMSIESSTFIVDVKTTNKISPLCMAVVKGDLEKVNQLISNGVDVNQKSNGMLPIHYAAKYNRVEVIKALITAGSKIHSTCDKGISTVRHAEKTNAKEALLFLKRFKNKNT